jgi:hypothetical protein
MLSAQRDINKIGIDNYKQKFVRSKAQLFDTNEQMLSTLANLTFRRACKISKSDFWLYQNLSVNPHGKTWLPLERFLWKYLKTFREYIERIQI